MAVATIKGGDKLKAYLANLSAKVSKPGTLRVGFLEGSTYPNGTSVPMVAAIQEFGAPAVGVPPRPYFRTMVKEKSPNWGPSLARILKANDYDSRRSLDLMGDGIKEQLAASISDLQEPALSPVTLMLRKMFGNHPEQIRRRDVGIAAARVAAGDDYSGVSTKPLIWTGFMQNSIRHEVKA